METQKDYAYGVVPVRKEADGWYVLVLHQIARADTYWTFPKGHSEDGENMVQTALRELKEETGLMPKHIDSEKLFTQQYTFKYKNKLIEKYVGYYIGYITDTHFTVQEEEVAEARWCTFAEARVLLTYDLARELLDEVALYLADKK